MLHHACVGVVVEPRWLHLPQLQLHDIHGPAVQRLFGHVVHAVVVRVDTDIAAEPMPEPLRRLRQLCAAVWNGMLSAPSLLAAVLSALLHGLAEPLLRRLRQLPMLRLSAGHVLSAGRLLSGVADDADVSGAATAARARVSTLKPAQNRQLRP